MTETTAPALHDFRPGDFDVASPEDEIRVDELCVRLLQSVRTALTVEYRLDPATAGSYCLGADLFLREFVIADCHDNLLHLPIERIRQFAGHWYIVRTLEPDSSELAAILAGVRTVYQVLAEHGLTAAELAAAVATACSETTWHRQRLDDYWAISGDGYDAWRAACPLPGRRS